MSGRAVAQAASCRLPTAATKVRARVKSCVFCGGQNGTGTGFLRVFWLSVSVIYTSNYTTIITIYHKGLLQ
jgi:hypothetical protein